MSLNSNPQLNQQSNASTQANPQVLQQRLNVREQEINGLKVQNRHLLGRIEELEKAAKPNQIDTQFVADEVRRQIDPIVQKMVSTLNTSFELVQSSLRGIYQQSQRSQKTVEDMAAQSRELEIRLNDQRKQDQNFYQDKVLTLVGNFCDRVERQIEIRLKALGAIETMNAKQNEILLDLEKINAAMESVQKNAESSRSDVLRMERTSNEFNQRLADLQVRAQGGEEIQRTTLQQIQNHRAEFKLIRSELRNTVDAMNGILAKLGAGVPVFEEAPQVGNPESVIETLVTRKQEDITVLEKQLVDQKPEHAEEDATVILSLLRAQKGELSRVAEDAKNYIKKNVFNQQVPATPTVEVRPMDEKK